MSRDEIQRPPDVSSGLRRAEAFSDAMFAIVITLLVLDLKVPDVPSGELLDGLLRQWPTYFAYVTSYLYVAVVWLGHKATFGRVTGMDRGLQWANLFVLSRPRCCRGPPPCSPTRWRNGT